MKYSIIVPVYNRPDEIGELLESLCSQTETDFEVIVVEDGSQIPCKDVCEKFASILDLHYYNKENSGPGMSRNYGAERSAGDYIIVLDSDVVLPDGYLAAINRELNQHPVDAFGGPDASHPSFTAIQKAISYSMTSFFTTGGIRGGKAKLDKFYPRSFNMGIRREVYAHLNGFAKMRFGEDIDFSYRIVEAGYSTRLFPEAWVWHKRRTDFRKFFKQVFNSGIARINLTKRHPSTLKLVHTLPAAFTIGCALLLLLSLIALIGGCPHWWVMLIPFALYALLIFADASIQSHSVSVGLRSIIASYVQLWGYGLGFCIAWWNRCVRKKGEFEAFRNSFYK